MQAFFGTGATLDYSFRRQQLQRLKDALYAHEQDLYDALYSDLKKSGKGDVIYTKRKWVKKAKGQAAGAVTVTQDKSIFVSLDRHRLEQLKTRSA